MKKRGTCVVLGLMLSFGSKLSGALELRGIVVEGDKPVASIINTEARVPNSTWLSVGQSVNDYVIQKIDVEQGLVTLRSQKHEQTLILKKAAIQPFNNVYRLPVAEPKQKSNVPENRVVEEYPNKDSISKNGTNSVPLNWDWIRSEKNPMRNAPSLPPLGISTVWKGMTEAQKEGMIQDYRQHGWNVLVRAHERGDAEMFFSKVKPDTNP